MSKRSESRQNSVKMNSFIYKFSYLIVLVLVFCLNLREIMSAIGPPHNKVVVCYIGTWAVYRPGKGSFAIEHLDPTLCTHVVYSFVGLNVSGDSIRSLDPWQDLPDDYGKDGFGRITKLKSTYPHLKVTVAIGGWNEGSKNYSDLASDPVRRKKFVVNAVDFVRRYKFDGLDLDWEFPGKRGGKPEDKQNFLALVKDLRSAFGKFNLLLTAAFGAGKDTIDLAYDVKNLSPLFDYVHLMCYDYHGTWDGKTGANSPLRSNNELDVETSVNHMLSLGMDPSKLVLGMPLYGRTFILLEELNLKDGDPKLGSVAQSVGFQGPYTREDGFMGYNEICTELQDESKNWTRFWDEDSSTPYLVNGNKLINYDDEKSITLKTEFLLSKKLAGAMVWSIDTDDFLGECSKGPNVNDRKFNHNFPLMRTINDVLAKASNEIDDNDFENDVIFKNNGPKGLFSSFILILGCLIMLY